MLLLLREVSVYKNRDLQNPGFRLIWGVGGVGWGGGGGGGWSGVGWSWVEWGGVGCDGVGLAGPGWAGGILIPLRGIYKI